MPADIGDPNEIWRRGRRMSPRAFRAWRATERILWPVLAWLWTDGRWWKAAAVLLALAIFLIRF